MKKTKKNIVVILNKLLQTETKVYLLKPKRYHFVYVVICYNCYICLNNCSLFLIIEIQNNVITAITCENFNVSVFQAILF